jgi:hypothetical protein
MILFTISQNYFILARLQVLKGVSMKITVLWDVELCSHLENDWHFRSLLLPSSQHHPDGGGSKYLSKAGQQDYMAQHPRRQTYLFLF